MKELELLIRTNDPQFVEELTGEHSLSDGSTISCSVRISDPAVRKHKRGAFGAESFIILAISFPLGVAASLLASWIYRKLNGKTSSLRIHQIQVEFEEGEIRKVVSEYIELN